MTGWEVYRVGDRVEGPVFQVGVVVRLARDGAVVVAYRDRGLWETTYTAAWQALWPGMLKRLGTATSATSARLATSAKSAKSAT